MTSWVVENATKNRSAPYTLRLISRKSCVGLSDQTEVLWHKHNKVRPVCNS